MRKLRISQVRSAIGRHMDQKLTLRALGITKLHRTVIHNDSPQIRGMVNKIRHLLEVEVIEENENEKAPSKKKIPKVTDTPNQEKEQSEKQAKEDKKEEK